MSLFSRRNSSPHPRYHYTLSDKVRSRIMHVFRQFDPGGQITFGHYRFESLLRDVGEAVAVTRGSLCASYYEAARVSNHPVVEHFFRCNDEEAVDFIELCLRYNGLLGDYAAKVIAEVLDQVFEEEGVGYEVIPTVWRDTGEPARVYGELTGSDSQVPEFGRVIKKGERSVHAVAVQPALESLSDPRFAIANTELLKAFEEIRRGDYPDAITSCGSAFESVMKTICGIKGWTYDANRDTCAQLVGHCQAGDLIPSFYVEVLKAVGTLRNKMGSVHGRGPAPVFTAKKEHAENMIAVTCAHIDLLIRLACA